MTYYPCGYIVGRVLLVDCFKKTDAHLHKYKWTMIFEKPEVFEEPIPYNKCLMSFFYIKNEFAKKLPIRYKYSWPV